MATKKKISNPKKNSAPDRELRITDTTLRDAHQSLWATRMRTEDIMGIIDVVDSVGYYSLEVWGGATFDVCMRFLRENPWERLRQIKARAKTPLQMLLRGQNVLGYKHYPDDMVERFVGMACDNGMDIFRTFDALNDNRNLQTALAAVKKYGGHAQGTLCYTVSPVHTVEMYVKIAREQVEMGIDSLAIKDMAGILSPVAAENLVSALAQEIKVPIQIHSHATSGMATTMYLSAVRAGAGAVDCAVSSMAGFSSQPPLETVLAIFEETPFKCNLDIGAIRKVRKYFEALTPKRRPGRRPPNIIDPGILLHHIPGGMISNLHSQLEQQGALDKLDEVFEELPKVRADLGYPSLVTPTSQVIGVMAVLNVIAGERYKLVPQEVKDYAKGLYGRSPAPIKPAIRKKILGNEKPITCRPADLLEPMLPTATHDLDPALVLHEEDVLSYCLFPEVAVEYFKWRNLPPGERPPIPADLEMEERNSADGHSEAPPPKAFLTQQDYGELNKLLEKVDRLGFNELTIRRDDLSFSLKGEQLRQVPVERTETQSAGAADSAPPSGDSGPDSSEDAHEAESAGTPVPAPLHGTFYISEAPGKPPIVEVGDKVKKGDKLCIVEAMKLFNEIKAPTDCRVVKILVGHGEAVEKDQPMMIVEEL
jgi:oxaloacetate decarboxylase alpha subunit